MFVIVEISGPSLSVEPQVYQALHEPTKSLCHCQHVRLLGIGKRKRGSEAVEACYKGA